MEYELFEDGIDGVHGLRRRERTRLWFRSLPPVDVIPEHLRIAIEHASHLAVTAPDLVDVVRVNAIPLAIDEDQVDGDAFGGHLMDDHGPVSTEERQERILRRLGSQFNMDLEPVGHPNDDVALTDWRNVPRNAPTLLLASSKLLDGRKPGPILGPGCEYRVIFAGEGVIGLDVRCADGAVDTGYCNAVDLTCIEPMIANLAGGSWKVSTKERLKKFTRGLTGKTGSLVSMGSN